MKASAKTAKKNGAKKAVRSLPQVQAAANALDALRKRRPLVACLTNSVAEAFTADVLLALGARCMMVADGGEVLKFIEMADAILVNCGTVTKERGEVLRAAVTRANSLGKPWVLDPVAYGPLPLRTFLCNEFMRRRPTVIRANASETAALAGDESAARGVDAVSMEGDPAQTARVSAACLTAMLTTGRVDYVAATDPVTRLTAPTISVGNGHEMLARVPGTGCAQGAIAAAFAAVASSPEAAAVAASLTMALAGEVAARKASAPGSFKVALVDALAMLKPADILKNAKVSTIKGTGSPPPPPPPPIATED